MPVVGYELSRLRAAKSHLGALRWIDRRAAQLAAAGQCNARTQYPPLFHFDGEFASVDDLIVKTLTGRNFGWLPDESAIAVEQIARVIRDDDGKIDWRNLLAAAEFPARRCCSRPIHRSRNGWCFRRNSVSTFRPPRTTIF